MLRKIQYKSMSLLHRDIQDILDEVFLHSIVGYNWVKETQLSDIISVTVTDGGRLVAKLPGRRLFSSYTIGQARRAAEQLNRSVAAFRIELAKLQVPMQQGYKMMISRKGFPVHIMPDQGEDCAQFLSKRPTQVNNILKQLLRSLESILRYGGRTVGLDARLSNFALSSTGEPMLIDTFPPLLRYHDEYLVHFPNPATQAEIDLEVQRKFGAFSILRRLWFELLAIDPTWDLIFMYMLRNLHSSVSTDVIGRFSLLHKDFFSSKDPRQLLLGLPPSDVETRREIAFRLLPVGPERAELVGQVIDLTSRVSVSEPERLRRDREFHSLVEKYCRSH